MTGKDCPTDLPFHQAYSIHGVPLLVGSEVQSILRGVEDRLRGFPHDGRIPANPLTFEYRAIPAVGNE